MLTTYTCWGLLFVNGCKMHLLENDMYTATTFSVVNKMCINKNKNWHVSCCHDPSAMTPLFEYGVKCTFPQTSRPSFECCLPSSLQAVQVFDLCMFGLCPPWTTDKCFLYKIHMYTLTQQARGQVQLLLKRWTRGHQWERCQASTQIQSTVLYGDDGRTCVCVIIFSLMIAL